MKRRKPAKQPTDISFRCREFAPLQAVDVWILPDHYDLNAPRWRSAREFGWIIINRRRAAAIVRRWRSLGCPRRRDRRNWLATALVWVALHDAGVDVSLYVGAKPPMLGKGAAAA